MTYIPGREAMPQKGNFAFGVSVGSMLRLLAYHRGVIASYPSRREPHPARLRDRRPADINVHPLRFDRGALQGLRRADVRSSSGSRRRTIRPILRDLTVPGLQPAENRGRASSGVSMRPTLCSAGAARGCASWAASFRRRSSTRFSTTSGGASTP
jgi:hypothetical protein